MVWWQDVIHLYTDSLTIHLAQQPVRMHRYIAPKTNVKYDVDDIL